MRTSQTWLLWQQVLTYAMTRAGAHAMASVSPHATISPLTPSPSDMLTQLPEASWEQRMHAVVQAGQRDPCHAKRLSKIWHWGGGFGSCANNFVNDLLLAMLRNESFAVCHDGIGSITDRQWGSHFSHEALPIARCACGEVVASTLATGVIQDIKMVKKLETANVTYIDGIKRMMARKLFSLSAVSQAQVDQVLDPVLSGVEKYIGIHIRRGDKKQEAAATPDADYLAAASPLLSMKKEQTTELLEVNVLGESAELGQAHKSEGMSKVRQSLMRQQSSARQSHAHAGMHTLESTAFAVASVAAKAGIRNVYVASDDRNASQRLQQFFQGPKLAHAQISVLAAPTLAKDYSFKAAKTDKGAMLALLADLYALQKATVFIGTVSSNLGRFVYYLRDLPSQPSISLEAKGNTSLAAAGNWNSVQG